jgi:hypothetical protein
LFALLAACSSVPSGPEESVRASATQAVPSEALNPDVRQETIRQTICVPGYTASVRPSTTYTNGVKAKLLRERDLPQAAAAQYELDHRIPLALGGHPRNLRNLELQPWDGEDSAKQKDRLERRLQVLVCKEQLTARRRAAGHLQRLAHCLSDVRQGEVVAEMLNDLRWLLTATPT